VRTVKIYRCDEPRSQNLHIGNILGEGGFAGKSTCFAIGHNCPIVEPVGKLPIVHAGRSEQITERSRRQLSQVPHRANQPDARSPAVDGDRAIDGGGAGQRGSVGRWNLLCNRTNGVDPLP
jgi:hypothetical protein